MAVRIVVGLGWGDEGKGRVVDLLGEGAAAVARFSGGANAGHTVVIGGETLVLHQLPTGLLRDGVLGLVGAGCVIDPAALCAEAEALGERGSDMLSRLLLSPRAHLVHPAYRVLERYDEKSRGPGAIGTTGFGIGPAYARKYARRGIRLEDALDRSLLEGLSKTAVEEVAGMDSAFDLEAEAAVFVESALRLAQQARDTGPVIAELAARGETVLAEGAQGTLIDPDHGTYPFVTCGSCVAGSACVSLGFGPSLVGEVVGVMKAYATRVGAGPFPTEIAGETGDRIRERGREYGRATGRPRRCGWFDAVLSRYAAGVNGCDMVALTLLDVLDELDEIPVCTSYALVPRDAVPVGRTLGRCVPVYEVLPGWKTDISGERRWESLPARARDYVEFLEKRTGTRIGMISTGPERDDIIHRR